MRCVVVAALLAACGPRPAVVAPMPSLDSTSETQLVLDAAHRTVSCGDDSVQLPASLVIVERGDATVIAASSDGAMAVRAWPMSVDENQPLFEWRELHERIAGALPKLVHVRGAARREDAAVVWYDADGAPFRFTFGANGEATCTVAELHRLSADPIERWTYADDSADEPTVALRRALKAISGGA